MNRSEATPRHIQQQHVAQNRSGEISLYWTPHYVIRLQTVWRPYGDVWRLTASLYRLTVINQLPDQAALPGLLQRITGLGLEVAGLHLVASESR